MRFMCMEIHPPRLVLLIGCVYIINENEMSFYKSINTSSNWRNTLYIYEKTQVFQTG